MKEIWKEVLKRFKLDTKFIRTSGPRKSLKKRIKLTWKHVSFYKKSQINEKTLIDRKRFLSDILPCLSDDANVIFLDECSFNLSNSKNMGWSISSKRIYMMQNLKSINYSLLAAITKEKVLAYFVSEGSITTELYCAF